MPITEEQLEAWIEKTRGMILRDHFAGLALQGLLTWHGHLDDANHRGIDDAINSFPQAAYKLADAMLRARK